MFHKNIQKCTTVLFENTDKIKINNQFGTEGVFYNVGPGIVSSIHLVSNFCSVMVSDRTCVGYYKSPLMQVGEICVTLYSANYHLILCEHGQGILIHFICNKVHKFKFGNN